MDRKLEANVLILGKTGAGKTALFNYLFGAEIHATGAGRPITEMGIFEETVTLSPDFTLKLYDSWGLEANKSSQWRSLIEEKLKEHNVPRVEEWFHAIIYCISAKSARVEDFDLEIIRSLKAMGDQVIVALTHADVADQDQSLEAMLNVLLIHTNVSEENIIPVSSQGKILLSGKKTRPFGKEALLERIKLGLLDSICQKMPCIYSNEGKEIIETWYIRCCYRIDNDLRHFGGISVRKEKERNRLFNTYAAEAIADLEQSSDALVSEAYHYYWQFCGSLEQNPLALPQKPRVPAITLNLKLRFGDALKALGDNLSGLFQGIFRHQKFSTHNDAFAKFYREGLIKYRSQLYNLLDDTTTEMSKELRDYTKIVKGE